MGFAYQFETLTLLDIKDKPEALTNLIKSVSSDQREIDKASDFHFICEVSTKLVSAKNFSQEPDIIAQVDKSAPPGSIVIERFQRLTDKYPYSYKQIWQKVKNEKPEVKPHQFNQKIKELGIKGDLRYSSYNFRSKEQRDKYEKEGF